MPQTDALLTRCRACEQPSASRICVHCAPSMPFCDPDRSVRMAALAKADRSDRPKVITAMLRCGRLWERDADALLAWLLEPWTTTTLARWLGEDTVHGERALRVLGSAKQEAERNLLRAPLWLAHWRPVADKAVHPLLRPRWLSFSQACALASRLGSCVPPGEDDSRYAATLSSLPGLARWLGGLAFGRGRRHGPGGLWSPTEEVLARARRWRRWPLGRLEGRDVLCCSLCGESLPAVGSCLYCGTSPDNEPPMSLPVAELLNVPRPLCPTCGFDICRPASPVRCPCCGTPATWIRQS